MSHLEVGCEVDSDCDGTPGLFCNKEAGPETGWCDHTFCNLIMNEVTHTDKTWYYHDGECHGYIKEYKGSWSEANSDCEDRGGYLSAPKNQDDLWRMTRIAGYSYFHYFWSGTSDWITEQCSVFDPWAQNTFTWPCSAPYYHMCSVKVRVNHQIAFELHFCLLLAFF